MDLKQLIAERDQLVTKREQALAQVNAVTGALAFCNHMIAKLQETTDDKPARRSRKPGPSGEAGDSAPEAATGSEPGPSPSGPKPDERRASGGDPSRPRASFPRASNG